MAETLRTSHTARFAAASLAALVLAAAAPIATPASADRVDDVLTTSERLEQGDSLVSPNGRYRLQLDHFGGLTLTERPNWLNGSPYAWELLGEDLASLVLQDDGNLVGYRKDGSVGVDFETHGSGATALRLQDDRNLVLFGSSGQVVDDFATYNDTTLFRAEYLLPGDRVVGEDRVSRLVMQTDGNLVLYRGNTALWSSRTQGNPGAGAYMQGDGNLVVYSSAATGRRPLFDSGTSGYSSTDFPAMVVEDREVSVRLVLDTGPDLSLWGSNWVSDRIVPGDELHPGDRRTSLDGRCTLVMQTDLNLVEYCGGRAVFDTGVPGPLNPGGPAYATADMQSDGNFVVYGWVVDPYAGDLLSRALFNTGTRSPGSTLLLQDDRNLVVKAPDGRPSWSRFTGRL